MGDGADTVDVWLIDGRAPCPDVVNLLALLGPDERTRAEACLSAADRREYVVAHAALHCIVGDRIGVAPAQVGWKLGPHGKPHLSVSGPGRRVEANLSHSGDVCMVAVSAARAVGVDIQRLASGSTAAALARRYFPPQEVRLVLAAEDAAGQAAVFARLWARKEALVKAAGSRLLRGLAAPAHGPGPLTVHHPGVSPHPVRVADLQAPPGYCAAVALIGTEPFRVVTRTWEWPQALWEASTARQRQPCTGS
jgi:4'-phosphopantetheinyl transferase